MIIIGNMSFESLGSTVTETDAILMIPAILEMKELEELIDSAKGVFYIDDFEYKGYTKCSSIQKVYSSEGENIYNIILNREETDLSVIVIGHTITYSEAFIIREQIEHASRYLPNDVSKDYYWMIPSWHEGIRYRKDFRIVYNEQLYLCLVTHLAKESNTPDKSPDLWEKLTNE